MTTGDDNPRPWEAERTVDESLARALIEEQFPHLAPIRLTPLGVGWDNTAYRVNDTWVFRFPRRAIAIALIEAERHVLPGIAPHLPLSIPVPTLCGAAGDRFPWPFAGYPMIPGRTACRAAMTDVRRTDAAVPIATFLAALHGLPTDEALDAGAPPDRYRRLEVGYRVPKVIDRLEQCANLGLIDDIRAWTTIAEAAPLDWTPGESALVHGDLYGRHVLVDDDARPCGVIDWGDIHVGDPANDLSIAHCFLPPEAHDTFRDAYGPIDDATWRVARLRGLQSAVLVLLYGHDIGDRALVEEGLRGLGYMRAAAES